MCREELPTIHKCTITIYKIFIKNLLLTSQDKQNDTSSEKQISQILRKCKLDIYSQIYVQGTPAEIQAPKHRNPIYRRKRPAACVIAQQCSSATFVSLRFHSSKEKFGARYKNFALLFLCVQLFKSESAEVGERT